MCSYLSWPQHFFKYCPTTPTSHTHTHTHPYSPTPTLQRPSQAPLRHRNTIRPLTNSDPHKPQERPLFHTADTPKIDCFWILHSYINRLRTKGVRVKTAPKNTPIFAHLCPKLPLDTPESAWTCPGQLGHTPFLHPFSNFSPPVFHRLPSKFHAQLQNSTQLFTKICYSRTCEFSPKPVIVKARKLKTDYLLL